MDEDFSALADATERLFLPEEKLSAQPVATVSSIRAKRNGTKTFSMNGKFSERYYVVRRL